MSALSFDPWSALRGRPAGPSPKPPNPPNLDRPRYGGSLPPWRGDRNSVTAGKPTSASAPSHIARPDPVAPSRGWTAADWRETYEERLALAMIDGEQAEPEARRIARESCVARWLDMHPATSEPDRCAWCGKTDTPGDIVPFGTEPIGHVWLHHRCWEPWCGHRRAQAAEALRCLGIIDEDTGSKQP